MNTIEFKPIGVIHTPFKEPKGTPIQPKAGKGIRGVVELQPEYVDGLADLQNFSHIILIYHLHLSRGFKLKVVPYLDDEERGLFATRAPRRPNAIGLSVVRLDKIEKNKLYVRDIDIIDGTPLLDIKPYVPEFDVRAADKKGWLEKNVSKLPTSKDDGRFQND